MRKFGVEIEFICSKSQSEICRIINRDTGIECVPAGYSDRDTSKWRMKTDGSLSRGGLELVTPILSDMEDLKKLQEVIKVLDVHGKVNSSCGIHVHTDARNTSTLQVRKLMKYIAKYELAMNKLVSKSRRGSSRWCSDNYQNVRDNRLMDFKTPTEFFVHLNGMSKRKLVRSITGTRYYKWNFQNYMNHGSVENRMHQGSLNVEKITNWILLNQAMVNCAFDERGTRVLRTESWEDYSLNRMLKELVVRGYLNNSQKSYFLDRAEALA
tara:strand:+ start:31518 stop:32321 length:804 start_codon:yes stop_codon:yes gene_type:complete